MLIYGKPGYYESVYETWTYKTNGWSQEHSDHTKVRDLT